MRIGMLSWESLYSIKVGGVAPHVSELSESLVRMGHEVHIFTRRGEFGSYDAINGVHYQRVHYEHSSDLLTAMNRMCDTMADRVLRVEKIFGKFDLLHGHDWHPVTALTRLKEEHKIPFIFTVHSTEWGRNGNNFSNNETSNEVSHREWLGCYQASKVIVTTQRMREELKKIYSLPDEKIRIIPNGIIKGRMRKSLDPGRIKEQYGIHPLAPVVLFCGRLTYQKGPDLLVEAIPYVLRDRWDAKFVFIGEGDMRYECERRATELGVLDSCRFLGYTKGSTKEDIMNACDLICIPSRNEPFGVVVLEGWDACKPVIATDAVSIIKNFQDGVTAYVQPQSLAWCIKHMLTHPDDMKRMAAAGQYRIETEFCWEEIARKTDEVYKECALRDEV